MSSFCLGIFFSMIATNLHINLSIKLHALLEGIYCSDCLRQNWPNQNPLLAHISPGRGPTHPYLCDIESNHHFTLEGQNWQPHTPYAKMADILNNILCLYPN